MIDLTDEILNDFLAEADDYYSKVNEGLEMIRAGQIALGIDSVFRPLHTIKGTAGFLEGLDPLAHFAHVTEDFMKAIQSGEVIGSPANSELLVQSLDEVFNMIEQLRSGAQELDLTGADQLEERIRRSSRAEPDQPAAPTPTPTPMPMPIALERCGETIIVRINVRRVHLPSQYKAISDLFDRLEPGDRVALDLSRVRTIGSTAWGAIWQAGEDRDLSVFGMNEACRLIFFRWNFDRHIKIYQDEDAFACGVALPAPSTETPAGAGSA